MENTVKMEDPTFGRTTTRTAKMEQKDLHMSAPKHLKEAFKLYKQGTYPTGQDHPSATGIDDLNKSGIPGEALPAEVRNLVFRSFMSSAPHLEPMSADDEPLLSISQREGSSYGSEIIPGRKQ